MFLGCVVVVVAAVVAGVVVTLELAPSRREPPSHLDGIFLLFALVFSFFRVALSEKEVASSRRRVCVGTTCVHVGKVGINPCSGRYYTFKQEV